MVKLELDYALEVDQNNEELAFEQLQESIHDELGSKFKLLRILQLNGPAGGWPEILIAFDGSLEECKKAFKATGAFDSDEVEEFIIDQD